MTSQIKVTPNYQDRTFTIRNQENGKTFAKYRTLQFSKLDFEDELMNTENDWRYFLRSDFYYIVK